MIGLIGLARRAGKIVWGLDAVRNAVRQGKARLVLVDAGISDASRKAALDSCRHYDVPVHALPEGILGRATGRETAMTAAVTDAGFADAISGKILGRNCGGACRE